MSRFVIRPIIASLAVSLAVGAFTGVASAAPDVSPAAESGMGHMGKKGLGGHHFEQMHAMRDAFWLPGVGPIGKDEVAKLKLDPKQQTLFDIARRSQQDLRKSMRAGEMNRHKALEAQLQVDKLDLHALANAQNKAKEQIDGQANQVRQKWLALWDSLNEGQRQQITRFVKERQTRWKAHHKEGRSDGGNRPRPAVSPAPSSAS